MEGTGGPAAEQAVSTHIGLSPDGCMQHASGVLLLGSGDEGVWEVLLCGCEPSHGRLLLMALYVRCSSTEYTSMLSGVDGTGGGWSW